MELFKHTYMMISKLGILFPRVCEKVYTCILSTPHDSIALPPSTGRFSDPYESFLKHPADFNQVIHI
jgi:hypothetical protein